MRRTIQFTNVEGAASQGVFSCQIPMGLDVFALYAIDENGVVVLADITNVKHYMNADIVRDLTGTQQGFLNGADQLPAFSTDKCLSIHLDMIGMKTVQATYGPTMNTMSPDADTGKTITSSRLEITLGGANVPKWTLWADVDDNGNGGPGFIERIKVFGSLSMGTSEKSFATTFPFGTPDVRYWRRLLVTNVSGGFTTSLGRLLRGSSQSEVFKRTKAIDARILGDYRIRTQPAGLDFTFDGTETGVPETWDTMQPSADGKMMETVGTMDTRLTSTGAATFDAILNTMGKF